MILSNPGSVRPLQREKYSLMLKKKSLARLCNWRYTNLPSLGGLIGQTLVPWRLARLWRYLPKVGFHNSLSFIGSIL